MLNRFRLVGFMAIIFAAAVGLSHVPALANPLPPVVQPPAPLRPARAAPAGAPTRQPGLSGSGRLSSHLATVVQARAALIASGGLNAIPAAAPISVVATPRDGVSLDQLAQIAIQLGGTLTRTYEHSIRVELSATAILTLSKRPEVSVIEEPTLPAPAPSPNIGTGSVLSQGVAAIGADVWQQNNWNGAGMNIAVFDTDFPGYPDIQDNYAGTGEYACVKGSKFFPPDTSINGGSRNTRGSQAVQVICDMAPYASIYVVRISSVEDMKAAVDYLVNLLQINGRRLNIIASMISASRPQGPGDTTAPALIDPISPKLDGTNLAIAYAQNNNILWLNVAGDYRQAHWGGLDRLGSITVPTLEPFTANPADTANSFIWSAAGGPIAVTLRWTATGGWIPGATQLNDFDLRVNCQNNGGPVHTALSNNSQEGGYPYPREYLIFPDPNDATPPTVDQFCQVEITRITNAPGTPVPYLDLFVLTPLSPNNGLQFKTPTSSVPSEENAFSVGSFCFNLASPTDTTAWQPDNTSSYGPINNTGGVGVPAPGNLPVKPDLLGPSNVSTSYAAAINNLCPSGFAWSAAATAHVAGEAALRWGSNSTDTSAIISAYLVAPANRVPPKGGLLVGEGNGYAHMAPPAANNSTRTITPTFTATVPPSITPTPTSSLTPSTTPTLSPGPVDGYGVYNRVTNNFYLLNNNVSGPPDITIHVGDANSYPVAGDWDGDGYDTVGIYNQGTGVFSLYDSNAQGAPVTRFFVLGNPGDLPMSGLWVSALQNDDLHRLHDGAGVFRPSNGLIYLASAWVWDPLNPLIFADYVIVLGNPGDKGLAGKWNGGMLDTAGVYRPSDARFYITNQSCTGIPNPGNVCIQYGDADVIFGAPYNFPVKGDWTGRRQDGIGLFQQSNGVTYLKDYVSPGSSVGFADHALVFGNPGSIPVSGHWKPVGPLPPPLNPIVDGPTRTPTRTPTATATPSGGGGNLD